jgi:hypothetical protein
MRSVHLAVVAAAGLGAGYATAQGQGSDPTRLPDFGTKIEQYYERASPTEQGGKCTNLNMTGVGGSEVVRTEANRSVVRVAYNYNSTGAGSTCVGSAQREFTFVMLPGAEPAIESMSGPM